MVALAQKLYRGALSYGSAVPAIRSISSIAVQTVGSNSFTVLSAPTIQVGDILVAVILTNGNVGTYNAPPSGWVTSSLAITGGADGAVVYMKTATYADSISNPNVNFGFSGTVTGKGFMLAIAGADTVDTLTQVIGGGVAQKVSTATFTVPGQAANLQKPVAGGGWLQYQIFFGSNSGLTITTAPAGMATSIALQNGAPSSFVSYYLSNGVSTNSLVWNTVTNGWMIDMRFYASIVGAVTLYTVPASTRTAVTDITVSNPTTAPGYASFSAGGVVLLPPTLINANSILTFSLKQVLLAGEVIAGGGSPWLQAHVSGAEMT